MLAACSAVCEKPWFRMAPILMTSIPAAFRTWAATWGGATPEAHTPMTALFIAPADSAPDVVSANTLGVYPSWDSVLMTTP